MILKTPRNRKRAGTRKVLREYTYLGCPLTRNRSPWCFRMCTPHPDGTGLCGRVAPHSFKSRIQQGIEEFKSRQAESSNLLRNQGATGREDS
jgi:hypothetical protein